MKTYRTIAAATAAVALVAGSPAEAQAPVAVCDALSLYANGARTGLCQSLSPTTQNLWVCELTTSDPDIHLTFNAGVGLHITVRTPPGVPTCQGNANLTGDYPSTPAHPLALVNANPICNVNVAGYIPRLAAVPQLPAAHGQTRVQTAILNAQAAGRVTPAVAGTYIATAANQGC